MSWPHFISLRHTHRLGVHVAPNDPVPRGHRPADTVRPDAVGQLAVGFDDRREVQNQVEGIFSRNGDSFDPSVN